jgi:Tol biopolymer transport system component
MESGELIAVLPGLADAAAWSPDGTRIAVALRNGTIKLWSTDD